MSPNPQHGTPAGIALRKLARQTGGDVQELMTLYALEGLLARIAASEYRDDFVLKGGVLLAAFAARRPTKDIDLQATRLTDDPDEVAERVCAGVPGLEPRTTDLGSSRTRANSGECPGRGAHLFRGLSAPVRRPVGREPLLVPVERTARLQLPAQAIQPEDLTHLGERCVEPGEPKPPSLLQRHRERPGPLRLLRRLTKLGEPGRVEACGREVVGQRLEACRLNPDAGERECERSGEVGVSHQAATRRARWRGHPDRSAPRRRRP